MTSGMLPDPASDPWMNPPHSLHIVIPFIPPTSNHIYVTIWARKQIAKSKEANAFHSRFMSEVVPVYLPWISRMSNAPETIYRVSTYFYLDQWDVLNKGWFQTPKKAQTRYKKMDTGNRLKLIHDCLSDALGVDDSHFFSLAANKAPAQEYGIEPSVHLYVEALPAPKDPVGTQTLMSV